MLGFYCVNDDKEVDLAKSSSHDMCMHLIQTLKKEKNF